MSELRSRSSIALRARASSVGAHEGPHYPHDKHFTAIQELSKDVRDLEDGQH